MGLRAPMVLAFLLFYSSRRVLHQRTIAASLPPATLTVDFPWNGPCADYDATTPDNVKTLANEVMEAIEGFRFNRPPNAITETKTRKTETNGQ